MFRTIMILGLILFLEWAAVAGGIPSAGQSPVASGISQGEAVVTLPRVWMRARDILLTLYRKLALKYVVVVPDFETPVGPFLLDEPIPLDEVISRIAAATGTRTRWIGSTVVFDPQVDPEVLVSVLSSVDESLSEETTEVPGSPPQRSPVVGSNRALVGPLADLGHSSTVPSLSILAGSKEGSTRFHALAALVRLEGDFMRNTWPGRQSIFEVLYDELDRDALLYALEEGGPPGGQVWKMAAEILGRAREASLTRGVWWNLWMNRPGTIRMTLWCMGRCGDPSGREPLRERIRNIKTNDIADLYLAALVLGELNAIDLLKEFGRKDNPEVRRAMVMGLGVCQSGAAAAEALRTFLGDDDPAVQFIACQSLGRLRQFELLRQLLNRDDTPTALWDAALQAVAENGGAQELQRAGLSDDLSMFKNDSLRLSKLAEVWGLLGGKLAGELLQRLVGHEDRWVRAAAVEALAKLGTSEGINRVASLLDEATENADVRIAAVLGLGRSLSPKAARPLSALAGNPSEHDRLRRYAVLALARLANRAGQKEIARLVNPDQPGFMPFAVRHVRFETPERTASALVPLLTHGDRDSACAAAGNLSDLGYGPGIRELLEGSEIFDNHTRMMHAWGSIRSRGDSVESALVEASESRRRLIRQGAALALGARHTVAAVDVLLRFADDEEEGVRAAAAQSLGLTADPKAIPVLIRLAEGDSSQAVRTEAIRALRNRDFAAQPAVRSAFARLASSKGDSGALNPDVPSIEKQRSHTFVLRNWADDYDEVLISNLTYETTMCFDRRCGRVIMWGAHGRRYDSPQTGQTWFYDASASEWGRLSQSTQWPNGTCCNRQMVFDQANGLAVVAKSGRGSASGGHGWLNGLRGNLSFSVPWVLDVVADEWYPMRPIEHFGNLGMVGGDYDPRLGLSFWWQGELLVYDSYGNEWLKPEPSGPQPKRTENSSAVFDPVSSRLIVVGVDSTWSYAPETNQWEDLKPSGDSGPTGAPMVYDSTNDVMLAMKQAGQEPMGVWVYHLRENRWERLPAVEPAPRYSTMFDAVYDPRNNVVVISGNESMSWSGALTARETWTYRYRQPEDESRPREPVILRDARVTTNRDGSATLTWGGAAAEGVTRYVIYRKSAKNALAGSWKPIGQVTADVQTFRDEDSLHEQVHYYAVAAQSREGEIDSVSFPVRTAPPAPRWVSAINTEEGAHITWQPSAAEDAIGFNVYRAEVDLGWPWQDLFDPARQIGELRRITTELVDDTEYVDFENGTAERASELHWPRTFAYVVKAVNRWGIEGGPSPVTLCLSDPPGPVQVIPWLDGRRLVLWSPSKAGDDLRGYHIMRMDDWHREYVFRWQAAPSICTAFYDDEEFPRADRRRYYISGVDVHGAVGIPSSGAWSHGLP